MEFAECRYCFSVKREKLFKKGTITKSGKGKCKECHNEYVRNYHIYKKSLIYPEKFYSCNNCDRVFCAYEGSSKVRINKCKFCGSKDFESLVVQL